MLTRILVGITKCFLFGILICLSGCKKTSESPNYCISSVTNAENTFTWKGSTYNTSGSSTNLVICSGNEIDAFYAANLTSQITFGFDKVSERATVSVNSAGLPSPVVTLKQGSLTFVAITGTLAVCQGGYQFSLGLKQLTNASNLASTIGSELPLTGLIKCP